MQTVNSRFLQLADGDVQPQSWGVLISFDKAYDPDITWFTLDVSVLDGPDILSTGDDNPIQQWDLYEYDNYTDRVVMMSWEREIEFPYSTATAMADVQLNNYDNYFTPGAESPIEEYIIPKRPIRLLSGFDGAVIPQFVGLTQGMPDIQDSTKTASFHALDFLTQIYDMPIQNTIAMRDVRTDEVLANIFEQFGLDSSQYNLAAGRNKIPFLFFEREVTKAGEVIRKLMQAEMGKLWLDEQGVVQFETRLEDYSMPVYSFDDSNIVDISTPDDSEIYNKIVINSELREVQEYQTIHTKAESSGDYFVIQANSTRVYEASLTDPAISAEPPTIGEASAVSWFTAKNAVGAPVSSDITVDATELRTNSYDITFTNDNAFPIEIAKMEIWGEPAKVFDRIEYSAIEQPSIDKYEEQVLPIDNNFIQSVSQCESLALTLLYQYSEHTGVVTLTVKGNPALQLGDVISLDARTYDGEYTIIGMTGKIQDGLYEQTMKVRRLVSVGFFTLDVSLLDGEDLLAP